jgi:hypothetical protein
MRLSLGVVLSLLLSAILIKIERYALNAWRVAHDAIEPVIMTVMKEWNV